MRTCCRLARGRPSSHLGGEREGEWHTFGAGFGGEDLRAAALDVNSRFLLGVPLRVHLGSTPLRGVGEGVDGVAAVMAVVGLSSPSALNPRSAGVFGMWAAVRHDERWFACPGRRPFYHCSA